MSERGGSGLRVLLCVGGGIAAYKAPELVRAFVAEGHEVRVVLTPAAKAFVAELALATVSKHSVRSQVLDVAEEGKVGHIELADWPDVVVVAPATADLLARAATGLADDLVTVCLLATRAKLLFAPAMNTNMWQHPATIANLATLQARGAAFVGPDRGELACGWIGAGRMIDPAFVVAAAVALARPDPAWHGRKVLVSAGPTRAYLDPVRFLTNASTGVMGFALAAEAASRGAEVTLVAGPVQLATPPGVRRIEIETAEQLLAAMDAELSRAPEQLVAMVAAVADLAAKRVHDDKLPKDRLLDALDATRWERGVDVLASLRAHHRRAFFLGFAAQTAEGDAQAIDAELLARGTAKLASKDVQALFVNRVGTVDTGFASPSNSGILLLAQDGEPLALRSGPPAPKRELAGWLLDRLAEHGAGAHEGQP
jgi:phosphopantothenoylcysteine decarboxylase / phosphopantothenate---cysteine ligase